jgi:ribose transport system ATP-binding protein
VQAPTRLEMAEIWKSFGGVTVLQAVDLQVEAGQVLALLGANGAGKSTLVKILGGVYQRDRGTIRLDGTPIAPNNPQAALGHGIRLLPQEISVLPDLSVAENIFIDALPCRRRFGLNLIDRNTMRHQARDLLDQMGLVVDPDQPVRQLPPSEQRLVEIARALAGRARVLVMDEPTAALTAQEAQRLFAIIGRLKTQGVAIIYISHYLDEVFQVADRIAVLRDGHNAGTFITQNASRQQILTAMLGTSIEALYPAHAASAGEPVLQVERLTIADVLDDLSLTVHSGQITGMFGLVGSGIDQVGRALFGALGPLPTSRIKLNGQPYIPSTPRHGRNTGIGFVAAERQHEGILPDLAMGTNMTLPFVERFVRWGTVSAQHEHSHVQHQSTELGIQAQSPDQTIRLLSGGNQQKVCLARWLVEGIKVLILEEPTRGVDLGARQTLYAALRQRTEQGLAVLISSTDVEEIAGISDQTIVLDRGQVAARFNHGVTPAMLLDAATRTVTA